MSQNAGEGGEQVLAFITTDPQIHQGIDNCGSNIDGVDPRKEIKEQPEQLQKPPEPEPEREQLPSSGDTDGVPQSAEPTDLPRAPPPSLSPLTLPVQDPAADPLVGTDARPPSGAKGLASKLPRRPLSASITSASSTMTSTTAVERQRSGSLTLLNAPATSLSKLKPTTFIRSGSPRFATAEPPGRPPQVSVALPRLSTSITGSKGTSPLVIQCEEPVFPSPLPNHLAEMEAALQLPQLSSFAPRLSLENSTGSVKARSVESNSRSMTKMEVAIAGRPHSPPAGASSPAPPPLTATEEMAPHSPPPPLATRSESAPTTATTATTMTVTNTSNGHSVNQAAAVAAAVMAMEDSFSSDSGMTMDPLRRTVMRGATQWQRASSGFSALPYPPLTGSTTRGVGGCSVAVANSITLNGSFDGISAVEGKSAAVLVGAEEVSSAPLHCIAGILLSADNRSSLSQRSASVQLGFSTSCSTNATLEVSQQQQNPSSSSANLSSLGQVSSYRWSISQRQIHRATAERSKRSSTVTILGEMDAGVGDASQLCGAAATATIPFLATAQRNAAAAKARRISGRKGALLHEADAIRAALQQNGGPQSPVDWTSPTPSPLPLAATAEMRRCSSSSTGDEAAAAAEGRDSDDEVVTAAAEEAPVPETDSTASASHFPHGGSPEVPHLATPPLLPSMAPSPRGGRRCETPRGAMASPGEHPSIESALQNVADSIRQRQLGPSESPRDPREVAGIFAVLSETNERKSCSAAAPPEPEMLVKDGEEAS